MAGKIRNGESWYRAMFENSYHGIILFDKIRFHDREINAAFSNLLHYQPEELGRIGLYLALHRSLKRKRRFLTRIGQSPEISPF